MAKAARPYLVFPDRQMQARLGRCPLAMFFRRQVATEASALLSAPGLFPVAWAGQASMAAAAGRVAWRMETLEKLQGQAEVEELHPLTLPLARLVALACQG